MTGEVRNRKPSSRKLSDAGVVIMHELRSREMSLSGWLDEQGFHPRFQRVAAEILAGRVTGERNTDPSKGGSTRAIMVAMSDDFGIAWEWMWKATHTEVAVYRDLMRKMVTNPRPPAHRERLLMKFDRRAINIVKELGEAKQRTLRTQNQGRRNKFAAWYMRGCVFFERCPVCLEPATYYSDVLNKRDGVIIRTQSVLCCSHGCFDGRAITSGNIL